MQHATPLIRIIDDDPTIRDSQSFFLRIAGYETVTYTDPIDFLEKDDLERIGCLILDVRMPKMSGIELQKTLKDKRCRLPIIFLSAHGDIEMAIDCVKAGALNFLEKPPVPEKLLELVASAVKQSVDTERQAKYLEELHHQYDQLTSAEKQVAGLVAKGLNSKTVCSILSISERTLQTHRSNIYSKLDIENPVELADFFHEMHAINGEN